MVEKLNDELQKLVSKNKENGVVKGNKKESTFAKVFPSKTSPIQVELDKQLSLVIGSKFLLEGIECQENVDEKTGEVKKTTIYSVRIISKKAKAFRNIVQIKVKNSLPIIKDEEADKAMLGLAKPIVLCFENIAHYAYIGGESLTASSCERLNISVQEAMNNE